jgi:predicted DNA repair protein MutK
MSVGLIALLDDIAGLAKVAAASVDDIAGQAARAGAKAAGVVIDDAAVTPRYVVGFDPARELPIIKRIAIGSLRNKLLILLPVSLALSWFAPWAITPLLMLGGAYLCFEGTEKVIDAIRPHEPAKPIGLAAATTGSQALEDQKVRSAIGTDFILSAEIMAITLASLPEGSFWTKAIVLAVVGIGITFAVYGAVALIVKADDIGLAMAADQSSHAGGRIKRAIGRGLVRGMPFFLKALSIVGTAAMIWVGGGILVHGLEEYGLAQIAHGLAEAGQLAASTLPAVAGPVDWIVHALGSGLIGLTVGLAIVPVAHYALAPLWRRLRPMRRETVPANARSTKPA